MPRPKKKTALVEVIGHYLLGSDRTYQRILQDSMATDHGVIPQECTNKGRTLLINFDMKYIDAEKLKAEIDNLESFSCISEVEDGFYSAISRINGIIDSLQQDPRFPLYDNIVEKVFGAGNLEGWERDEAEMLVALAKEELLKSLQQEQPEIFDSVAFQKGVAEGRRLEREDAGRLADASKTISEDLEEAAEKYGSDYPAYNDDQFIAENAFKTGAEWMAKQGVSYQDTISSDKTIPVLPMKDVSDMGLDYGDKVIVQIRKKE